MERWCFFSARLVGMRILPWSVLVYRAYASMCQALADIRQENESGSYESHKLIGVTKDILLLFNE